MYSDIGTRGDGLPGTREDTEAQKDEVTCPRSPNPYAMGTLLSCAPFGWDPGFHGLGFPAGPGGLPALPLLGSRANAPAAGVSSSCWKVLWECEERTYPGPAAARYLWEHACTPGSDASTPFASPLHMPPRDAACVGRSPAGYKFIACCPIPSCRGPSQGPRGGCGLAASSPRGRRPGCVGLGGGEWGEPGRTPWSRGAVGWGGGVCLGSLTPRDLL